MVTETDIAAVKDRIITILKNATTGTTPLWQDNHENGFQDITLGVPTYAMYEGLTYPRCFVTNDDDLEDDKPFGPITNSSAGASEHTYRFKIIILDQQEDSEAVERSLDAYYKRIKEVLKANVKLGTASDPSTGQLATWSWPIKGKSFSAQFSGRPIDGRILIFAVKTHTN